MSLIQPYNPFEPLTIERIQQLLLMGQPILVVQRFQWAGINNGAGFMATRYSYPEDAADHLSHLLPNEGKMVDLLQPLQRDRLLALIAPTSTYQVYLDSLKDKKWAKRMQQVYAEDVRRFIRSQTRLKPDRNTGVDVNFDFRHGRVMAVINTGTQRLEVPFYDIIK
ncbi:hypothetical protein [Chitinophaga sancti]|uniref:Uncharacterized protein n=1 Tax=Chitinophaga sancti TaxID=1004 RepID=A0A1K1R1Q0_9BACT|nr:hypothetical protein [Chitinophaga sancti]WQD64352.1 hypothetical protein U0033_08085 [Chitinophaga sancti]WQG90024.1 hypothetical protein SR876_00835 [Chitinophaga sancti]SFW66138.1 hypothetical protein SAMN05661012_03288 [Chitinophaga sancti]